MNDLLSALVPGADVAPTKPSRPRDAGDRNAFEGAFAAAMAAGERGGAQEARPTREDGRDRDLEDVEATERPAEADAESPESADDAAAAEEGQEQGGAGQADDGEAEAGRKAADAAAALKETTRLLGGSLKAMGETESPAPTPTLQAQTQSESAAAASTLADAQAALGEDGDGGRVVQPTFAGPERSLTAPERPSLQAKPEAVGGAENAPSQDQSPGKTEAPAAADAIETLRADGRQEVAEARTETIRGLERPAPTTSGEPAASLTATQEGPDGKPIGPRLGVERAGEAGFDARRPLAAERIAPETLRVIEEMREGGSTRLRANLRLHPAELGRLRIDLRLENDQLSARIVVDSGAARERVEAELDRLREALAAKDFAGAQVDVQLSGRDDGTERSWREGDRQAAFQPTDDANAALDEARARERAHDGLIDLRA